MFSIEYCNGYVYDNGLSGNVFNIDYGYVYDNGLSGNVFNIEYCIVLY